MRRWSWIAIVVLGTVGFVRADEPVTPAAAEAAPEKEAAAEASADKPAEAVKPEAEAETKSAEDKPAAKSAAPKADPALEAAKDDPDVAARMETLYPLDGEEWREYPLGVLEMEMQEAIEDLSAQKAKPPALVTQPRIISRLDVMIEELEKKTAAERVRTTPATNPLSGRPSARASRKMERCGRSARKVTSGPNSRRRSVRRSCSRRAKGSQLATRMCWQITSANWPRPEKPATAPATTDKPAAPEAPANK